MPSYRIVIDIYDVVAGVAPEQVLPHAEAILGGSHRVEDRKLELVDYQPQIMLRYLVEGSNDVDEDTEALAAAEALVEALAEVAFCGVWTVRRRDGRVSGGWPRIGGGVASD